MKSHVLHILFILVSLSGLGQKPMVLLIIDPKEAEIGEMLTITLKSNIQGEVDIELPTGFVHGYNVMNGMEQEMDHNTGKVITYYYLSQTGAMNKEGNFTFGPAYIKKGSKVYHSNTVTVSIKKQVNIVQNGSEITTAQLRKPAFGVIETSKKSIYEGEPVIINARVYSHFDPHNPYDYQSYSIDNVIDKHEIGNNQRILIEETKVKGVPLFTFAYDKNVVFPTGSGTIDVDPFKIIIRRGYESLPVTSSSTSINIKSLPPAPADFNGGVGIFGIERKLSNTTFRQGEVLTMIIKVRGTGNIHNILEPKLKLPKGFIVYGDPVVTEDYIFTSKGAEGSVTFEYNIQITQHGAIELSGTTLSYFDPVKARYIQVSTNSDELNIQKDSNFKQVKERENASEQQKILAETGPLRPDHGNEKSIILYGKPIFWIGVTSPVFLGFLFGLLFRKRKENEQVKVESNRKKSLKNSVDEYLLQAVDAFKNENDQLYYSLIEKALLRSLSLKLRNDESIVLTKSEILHELEEQHTDQEIINHIKLLLDKCEMVRYGLGAQPNERIDVMDNVKDIIKRLHS